MLRNYDQKIFIRPAKKAEYGEIELNEIAKSIFSICGIEKLYKHQVEGIKHTREGKNVVIVAPTASGKSEIYMNAAIEAAMHNKNSLILYPTKALSRDQYKRFASLALYGINTEIYDGDTPQHKREKIRKNAPRILITNFDMLHFILLNNGMFHSFLSNLKLVVVDELHSYTGIFGGHVSNIITRLKRVMEKKYSAKVQFICTSATIGNAKSFARLICGEEFEEIKADGAPISEVEHIIINPEGESYTTTSLHMAEKLEKKTLLFANSHSVAERLGIMGKKMGLNISVYRAGLDYAKRREIEHAFKNGNIRILASTSALELGMDIRGVDVVVLAGFPGSNTKVKQRIGRAGREGQKAYGVYVARDNPLDQYYVENINEYLHGEPEYCFANPYNKKLLKIHLLSSARDALLSEDEINENNFQGFVQEGLVKKIGKFYAPTPEGLRIIRALNIRGIGKNIRIIDEENGKQIGERDLSVAINELFEGAIYLHAGEAWISESFDTEIGIARVRKIPEEVNFYTQALSTKDAEVLEEITKREVFGYPLSFGKIHLKTSVHGFLVKETFSGRKMGEHSFKKPYVYDFDTYGIWVDFEKIAGKIKNFGDGLHGFEHVFIAMIPALTGADAKEVGGLSYSSGRMYVYDGAPDGNGITDVVFKRFEKAAEMARERLKNCPCEHGCPKCILDSMCGNDNRFLDKQAAVEILDGFVNYQPMN